VKQFFDSSVLIAALWEGHVHHQPSFRRFESAAVRRSSCAVHTLAEVYAVMTALPLKPVIPPEQGLLFVEELRSRLTTISLTVDEYHATIRGASDRGLVGGRIYDALLLRCAEKANAEVIYTWNLKHFRSLAPHLAARIETP